MIVAGITLYEDRPLAVAVPPAVMLPAVHAPDVQAGTNAVGAKCATAWQQHPNPFDRSGQDLYDQYAHVVHSRNDSGRNFDLKI